MKFICDQMLVELGKWLRIAGYDTVIIMNSESDAEILKQAIEEKRYLLTRDHHFLEMKKAKDWVIYLNEDSLEECIKELSKKFSINWLKDPFSRCLLCNDPLIEANEEDLTEVPKKSKEQYQQFLKCPKCQKIYWQGTHTDRMLKQLKEWDKRYRKNH